MVEGYFDRLPCEILHNIALMLPFISILQLKCSSKFWYNLLTDPKFVELHLAHALEKPPGYLFIAIPQVWSPKRVCHFVEQSRGRVSTSNIFDFEYAFEDTDPADTWNDFQSGGGLMFAYSSRWCCVRIINPHIGEEVQVPYDHKLIRLHSLSFNFSYSPSTKEYKILKVGELRKKGQKPGCGSYVAEICTLGSNIWREIQIVPSTLWYTHRYTQCQGDLFWMHNSDLYFFDLVSEKFQVVPGPPVHVTDNNPNNCFNFMVGDLISMGHTVGYLHNYRLWVLEDKTKGIWINRYDFSIPPLYQDAKLYGTSENGHLFGYNDYPTDSFFSHDMGCKGFKVMEMNLDERGSEEKWKIVGYIAPHVKSFVSPVRIVNMGKRLNHKRKRVLDKLKLDYDVTDDDIFDRMYEFLEAYEISDKAGQDL